MMISRLVLALLLALASFMASTSWAQSSKNVQLQGGLAVKGAASFNSKVTIRGKTTLKDVDITGTASVVLPADSIAISPVRNGAVRSNALTSQNLQDAIDNELAVDLQGILPGSTWSIRNKSADTTYANTVGRITFSLDGKSFTLNSGRFASAGLVSGSEDTFCFVPLGDISYQLFGRNVMYMEWLGGSRGSSNHGSPQEATVSIFIENKDSLQVVGTGGCGGQGIPRISILQREQ